jgi:murein DD-endopeptidase MepM/ murein hydrolase activator NlpD
MVAAMCPRCDGAVALHEGRPIITPAGAIELWHRACWSVRDVPLRAAAPVEPPRPSLTPRTVRWIAAGIAASSLVAIGLAQWSWAEVAPPPASALANVELRSPELIREHSAEAAREVAPARELTVETALEAKYEVPTDENGARLDEQFPTLRAWTHPVTGSAELMPPAASRHFGAERVGIERPECGAGHCGVDLDGPRGRPIVAVAAGVVVRVERSELGLDHRSGRYVRIEHGDGTLTAYMHMDDVADELQVGTRVDAGQYVGTLGATAVYSAPPHLHFSLEVPNHPGAHGDNTDTHYVDPAPFLVRSSIARAPHAVRIARAAKPAS